MSLSLKPYNKLLLNSFIILTSLASLIGLQKSSLEATTQSQQNYAQQSKAAAASLAVQKRFPSFGYDNLVADWAFLQFIQYFGDTDARSATDYSLVPDYFEMVVNNDPRFLKAELILSTANSVFAGEPEKSVKYLNEAVQFLSPEIHHKSYAAWQYKGLDEMMFLGDIEAAKHSYQMAAKWAKEVGATNIVNRVTQTVAFLEDNPDSKRARVTGLVTILSNAPDPKTRQEVIKEIESLGGKVTIKENGRVSVSLPEED